MSGSPLSDLNLDTEALMSHIRTTDRGSDGGASVSQQIRKDGRCSVLMLELLAVKANG